MDGDWVSGGGSRSVRATDDDRGRVSLELGDALARGALDADEYERRVSDVWSARYVEELATLCVDLPGPAGAEVARAQRDSDMREWVHEWRWWLGGALIMSAIWGIQALSSGPDFFWPIAPLGIWAAILVAVAIWPRTDDR
ncbi:MAG: DUF1707 domain-containing protein [Mycobacteriaceae bacterium]